ncbi:hypothetical protein NUW54_g3384 [Trametes sanguinea]|uniref:Uncharacterized protein n=1 Tax=Trametes sanguinea TaxID=158606 RepID=A0ACC1Q273_9APHY|nr:hypothetical protein NUW54_g3384 [Trametes sanguinea]
MCHWRRVRNNYKRCGHYVDLPDEMVRPSAAYSPVDRNSVGTSALRFNATIVTASSALPIPGIASRRVARRLAGSTVNFHSSITQS